jgi:hypothetical protein
MIMVFMINSLPSEEVDLFIVAGQSNAQGWQGNAAFYPPDPNGLDGKIRFFWKSPGISDSGGKWTTLQKQGGRFPAGHFGLEVSFARKLKENGYNPAIFKYSLGATSIASHWKQPGGGGMYDDMGKLLATAVAQLVNEGNTVKFQGFIWIQGESDAQTKDLALAYEARLRALIDDLRTKIVQAPAMPVILSVDEQHQWVVSNPEIVTAQKHLAQTLKDCVWVSMMGLEKADGTHLTPAGLVLHGQRVYDAYLQFGSKPAGSRMK